MADDVDTESDDEIECSGMIQPPLIKQLQTILSEYPDDGQILKELIQNAEDAGASEMKILYDDRPAVQEPSTKRAPFRKYFKGPALLVYNNAEFIEADWTGIKMLYSSIKEFDKTKVGRFGLGFKSVFHITDHPVIISGDQLLVLDPHQDSSKVCQTMKLKKLHRYKKMKVEDCLKAFSGVFGFDQNTLEYGHFNGTIFRFPLRKEATELSDTIYDKSKVDDLFMSFKDEAPVSLLFLKCLESITLLREENAYRTIDIGEVHYSVKIDGTTIEAVRSARNIMKSHIQVDLQSDIENSYFITICVKDHGCDVMSKSWKVMNLFQGKSSMSSHLQKLSNDDSLSYSPYVGVAMDMDCPSNFQGHVFCFLPLPLTEENLSGLPIHVNGFFALNQSRRFVKWPTTDQIRNHTHTDKSIQWNQALVIEVLSEVYFNFLRELVKESSNNENDKAHVATVSRCIPNVNEIDEHWKILIPPLKEKLEHSPIFFTTNEGGKWITKEQTVFFRPTKIANQDFAVDTTVRRILEMYCQNTVEVEEHVWDTLQLQGKPEVTPDFINRLLRTSDAYLNCSDDEKINLLRYLLSARQYNALDDLALLPLRNGNYIKLERDNTSSCEIYIVPNSKIELLVGMEDRILSPLPKDIQDIFVTIVEEGIYQIRYLQEQSFILLLKETIQKNISGDQYPIYWNISNSSLDFNWLRKVWKCIVQEFPLKLHRFQDLPLIPEKLHDKEYQLHALREDMMIGNVSENISKCLDMFCIKVLKNVPDFILDHPNLNHFVPDVSIMNIDNAIGLLAHKSTWINYFQHFNSQSSADQKNQLLNFLCKDRHNFGTDSLKVLQMMEVFSTSQGFVSINENKKLLTRELPAPYPSEVIQTLESNIIHFAKQLGAYELQDTEIFSNVLKSVLDKKYNTEQVNNIMKFIIENKIYELDETLYQLVRKVPFVTTESNEQKTAQELFDPKDHIVQKIISDRSHFPSPSISSKGLKVLRKFGLKSRKQVAPEDIYYASKTVHESSITNNVNAEIKSKQCAIVTILAEREELFTEHMQTLDASLKKVLMDMEIVQPLQTLPSCLPNLSWYRCNHIFCKPSRVYNGKYGDLIGYVAPVISPDTSPILIQNFGWNKKPDLEIVLQQHSLYVDNYQEEYKSEYLLPIKRLYTYLAEICVSANNVDMKVDKMWMGEGFVEPNQICINRSSDDIDLKPYLVPLPKEFQTNDMKCLAEHLGCRKQQTTECLISILHSLKSKYQTYDALSNCIPPDMDIIIRILNKLKNVPGIEDMGVPIPIHSIDKSKLEFRAAKECNYCNAEWLKELAEDDGELMFFVHEDVSSDTAAKLGVPSLTENLLSETEGIQEWGQKEPLTRRIKNLLKDYKDGFVVPKELVQNADDAKATKICFLYDERENKDCRTRLIDENMASCQGPALWAFNDALFSQKDLENITKLSGATKADDLTKVGKFGLGFCSVYNLTDVPSFITGSNMVIFDPHAKYIGKAVKRNNPGLKIDLTATKNKILIRRMKNQFKPFNGIFGCNLDTENPSFTGTLFRFPFRTSEQAVNSEISNKTYDEQEIKSMIQLFVKNVGNIILFTQHVKEIEFYHLPRESFTNNPVLLHRVCRNENSSFDSNILQQFGSAMKNYQQDWRKCPEHVTQTSVVTILTEATKQCRLFCEVKKDTSEAKWIISWASGTTVTLDMGENMSHKGVLPLASTAMYLKQNADILTCSPLKETPEGFYKESHIFCYLPLPVTSPFPVHVNGSFAVSANRRQLSSSTTDDKNDFENDWNEALLSDAVVNAYIHLIESLNDNKIVCEQYETIWPIVNKTHQCNLYSAFYKMFYYAIIQRDSRVFCGKKRWLPLSQCIFLDLDLQESVIGEIATVAAKEYKKYEQVFLISLKKQIVGGYIEMFGKLPEEIQSKIISIEDFFLDIFLENIDDDFWTLEMIKSLVQFALDKRNKNICSKMETIKCIPTSPNGTLKMPKELVKRSGKVASLFCEEEERFPIKEFETYQRQSLLESMGMMTNVLSDDLLIERISSVLHIAKQCLQCSIEKCRCILAYIQESKTLNEDVADKIKNIPFLPTLQKPKDWLFPWLLDEKNSSAFSTTCSKHHNKHYKCLLAKPADIYMDNVATLVGCQRLIIDIELLTVSVSLRNILPKIGVNHTVQHSTVIQQLITICQNVNPDLLPDASKQLLGNICRDIYRYLDNACRNNTLEETENLKSVPCLLIDDTFVRPNQTAFTIPVKCSPKLYGLDRIQWKRNESFLKSIGVKKTFHEEDVIPVLKEMARENDGELDEKSLVLACNLVELLANVTDRHSPPEKFKDLCIPDENGVLSPIRILCRDDSTLLRKGKSLKFIHPRIRGKDAEILGVQSKIKGSLVQNYITPFGQKEELSDRIKRILQQYPFSESVLKEMLQNADDAKASEVMFITDFNTYGTEKTFESKWHPLQGPALLIYNNSYFTDEDIAGIQHLGRGSKGDDPTKTGQYGVGFNAVYHITDVPSFLSKSPDKDKDTLCVMDPNCKYAPDADENSPGARFLDLDDLRKSFPDVFTCYHENILLQSTGTIFRLPLRTTTFAEKSELSKKEVTEHSISEMLHNLESEITKSLLFLRHVRKIKTASITNGKLIENTCTELEILKEHQNDKLAFDKYVVEKATQFKKKKEIFNKEKKDVQYHVTLKRNSLEDRQWCIFQTFGFKSETEIPASVQAAFDDDDLGLLPQGGVAVPLDKSVSNASAFCFLPLPCETGLTMHINGHFSLDNESRRGLWKDIKKAYRTEWNNLLLCQVIAPIYAEAMEYLQKTLGLDSTASGRQAEMQDKIDNFHSFFPNIEDACDKYWKDFVKAVYKYISKRQMRMFLSHRFVDRTDLDVSCYSLCEDEGNVLFLDITKNHQDDDIITISKNLGAKVVNTPSWVCASIESSGLALNKFNPDILVRFLKSSLCKIKSRIKNDGQLELNSSPLITVRNVKILIDFCSNCENFCNEIEGLPLCLLETGNLVEFRSDKPVFLTSFSDLIPKSKEKILHHELQKLLRDKKVGCIEVLHLQQLVELLPFNINYDVFRHKICQWNPNQTVIPNKQWMLRLWTFLRDEVGEIRDQIRIKKILHFMLPWSIIPTTKICGKRFFGFANDVKNELFPLENATHVMDLSTFQTAMLSSLKKMNLPVLNSDFLPHVHPLRYLVASQGRVQDVLECLFVHKQMLENNEDINVNDCDTVMEYFAGGLQELLKLPNSQNCLTMLRKLPLFTTVHGQKITLEENRDILALPKGLPADGMIVWAEKTGKILLRQNNRLIYIFQQFNVAEQSICDLYAMHILPFFQNIPKENRMKHLLYIRDDLLKNSGNYDSDQNLLINALKKTPFIPQSDGAYFKASCFFSPFNKLMTVMCEDSLRFPPKPFNCVVWKVFMTTAGMITEITTELFLKFALQQELQGERGLTQDLEKKSECLVRHLLISSQLHTSEFLKRVSKIKFIVPCKIESYYTKICPNPVDDSNHLIAFGGSVMSTYVDIAWTQYKILPKFVSSEIRCLELSQLEVKKPSKENIKKHIKTVCNRLGGLSEKSLLDIGVEKISSIMIKFYEYARDGTVFSSFDMETFKSIPFVFLSEFPGIFPCSRFVLQLEEEFKMIPYLMDVPDDLLGSFTLFERFGASRRVSPKTFANVLHQIYLNGNELNPNELKTAQKAMTFFCRSLSSGKMVEDKDLFFLSRSNKLVEAASIVYIDNTSYKKVLQDAEKYFQVMAPIEGINDENILKGLKGLPKKIRPKFISSIIQAAVNFSDDKIVENEISAEINDFFRSGEFVNGVLRLVCQECLENKEGLPPDDRIHMIKENLSRMHMVFVRKMEKVYSYKDTQIYRKPCMNFLDFKEDNGYHKCTIYSNIDEENYSEKIIKHNLDNICRSVRKCTGCNFHTTTLDLAMICLNFKSRSQIEPFLDEKNISSLNNTHKDTTNQLPRPGDILEIRWYSILDNAFISFEPGEYVAYLSGMNELGDIEYKYGIIIEKLSCDTQGINLPLLQEYLVEIRPKITKNMKVYELYKFNRSKDQKDEKNFEEFKIQVLHRQSDTEEKKREYPPSDNRTLDEIFSEVRASLKYAFTLPDSDRKTICRRIMRKWHPDKNPHDVSRATKVFQYIRRIIQKLENGENVDVNDKAKPTNTRYPWSENLFEEFERSFRREQNYERHYSSFSSNSSKPRAKTTEHTYYPNPQPFTANKWLDEAKYDICFTQRAEQTNNNSFSWICFSSYKAAEKALIAWQYNEDANCVNRSENLSRLAQNCSLDLRDLATELQNLTRGPQTMMYLEGGRQPSKVYVRAQASKAMELATKIIDKVHECLIY